MLKPASEILKSLIDDPDYALEIVSDSVVRFVHKTTKQPAPVTITISADIARWVYYGELDGENSEV